MASKAMTFSEALSAAPMRTFQWLTIAVCMLVLVSDGVDLTLLGTLAPLVIADFGVDRATFGIAMSAALVGFGLGAWLGGWLGDTIGRRITLAVAALVFALATIAASTSDGVWVMAMWRVISGLGFGAAYANAIAQASEWAPERLRPVIVSTLAVGTPIGGTIVGWLGPGLAEAYRWQGAFVVFGGATLLLIVIILAVLRDSPSLLMARGKREQAERAAKRLLKEDIELTPERHGGGSEDNKSVGVLHASNFRLNFGIALGFTAATFVAYSVLGWTTTMLTASGFTLPQAGGAVSIAGITSMIGSIAAGLLARRFGSRLVLTALGIGLVAVLAVLAMVVDTLPAAPNENERLMTVSLIGVAAALFSAEIATMYVVMVAGYPSAHRSAGIGFGIFTSRVGAISGSGLGGVLLDLGHGDVTPFFGVLAGAAMLVTAAAFVINRHVPPSSPKAQSV